MHTVIHNILDIFFKNNRFDKNVEKELEKHEETSSVESFIDPTIKPKSPRNVSPRLLQTSTSGIDIAGKLRTEPDTELSEAVEKLARAEATFHFVGAVRAAEAAAAAVSPEYAEEAAAAGARDFHAEVTDVLRNTTLGEDGNEVIQLVGYMGITRPKTSKR